MEKLNDEQLSDFISQASPQLTHELSRQMFSIIQELIIYRSRKNDKREEKLLNLIGNMERICAFIKEMEGKVVWTGTSNFTIEGAINSIYRDIEDARLKGFFVGTSLAMPYKLTQEEE